MTKQELLDIVATAIEKYDRGRSKFTCCCITDVAYPVSRRIAGHYWLEFYGQTKCTLEEVINPPGRDTFTSNEHLCEMRYMLLFWYWEMIYQNVIKPEDLFPNVPESS